MFCTLIASQWLQFIVFTNCSTHTWLCEDSPGFCQEIEVRSHVSEWPKVNQLWSSQHLLWRRTACSPSSLCSLAIMKCAHCTTCSFSPKPYHVFFFPPRMFFPGLFTKLRPTYYSRLSSSFLVGSLYWNTLYRVLLAGCPFFIAGLHSVVMACLL